MVVHDRDFTCAGSRPAEAQAPLAVDPDAVPKMLLGKLPEEMTLLEKKITGFVRMLLEAPDLVLVEDFAPGLDSADRMRIPYFATTYLARHPRGTFVQVEDVLVG